jgi:hypothetical protein
MEVAVSAEAAATLPVVFRKSRRDTRSLESALMEDPLNYVYPDPAEEDKPTICPKFRPAVGR